MLWQPRSFAAQFRQVHDFPTLNQTHYRGTIATGVEAATKLKAKVPGVSGAR